MGCQQPGCPAIRRALCTPRSHCQSATSLALEGRHLEQATKIAKLTTLELKQMVFSLREVNAHLRLDPLELVNDLESIFCDALRWTFSAPDPVGQLRVFESCMDDKWLWAGCR